MAKTLHRLVTDFGQGTKPSGKTGETMSPSEGSG